MTQKRVPTPANLDQDTGREVLDAVREADLHQGETLVLDLAATESIDARGGAWLVEIAELCRARGGELRCEGQHGPVAEFLTFIEPGLLPSPRRAPDTMGWLERLGDRTLTALDEFKDFANLLADAVYWMLLAPFEGKGFRWGLFVDELYEMGVRAMQINFLMNFLLGLTIAMLSAAQTRRFGLDLLVADLVMIGFARELAALMTAVVVSARTGAAITAEIATMKVQEEIDALRGMGLNVPQFLIAPKLLALVAVMPCLVAFGMIAGILGGATWGIFVLGFPADAWFEETLMAATFDDMFQGFLKSFFFANVIVLVGCHNGLRVEGGSRGVGLMTTRSVVMDIFFIVVIDMIFAAVFYYVLD